jgi:hypothetical protein
MSVFVIFYKLLGRVPVESDLRFERNIQAVEDQLPELERLQANLAAIGRKVTQAKSRIQASTVSSGESGEHPQRGTKKPKERAAMSNGNEGPVKDCPFGGVRESQILRRRDLLDLTTAFQESFAPIKDLVQYQQRQGSVCDRLQYWIVVLVAVTVVGVVMQVAALAVLARTVFSAQPSPSSAPTAHLIP